MENIILCSNCWEILPDNKGYISTHVRYNREENTSEVSYNYFKTFGGSTCKPFTSYLELKKFIASL